MIPIVTYVQAMMQTAIYNKSNSNNNGSNKYRGPRPARAASILDKVIVCYSVCCVIVYGVTLLISSCSQCHVM